MAAHSKKSLRRFEVSRWIILALTLGVIALSTWLSWRPVVALERRVFDELGAQRVEGQRDWLLAAARTSGLDANLLAAVAFVESRGKLGAVSSADALGLFQLRL